MAQADIIAQLKREILPFEGYKSLHSYSIDMGLGPIKHAFPFSVFPTAAVHEFFCNDIESATASAGFITGIISSLMQGGGTAIWIGAAPHIFPPGLKTFGINPDHIIFLKIKNEKEILWAIEEALKCISLSAVVGEIADLTLTASRRFQLAVEGSGVTSFLLRRNPRNLTTACVSRWRVTPLSSISESAMPGIGHSHWKVELLKVRSGTPGTWQIEWKGEGFKEVRKTPSFTEERKRKAG